jgi:hypothetical protein
MEGALNGTDIPSDAANHAGSGLHLARDTGDGPQNGVQSAGDLLEADRDCDQPYSYRGDQDDRHDDCADCGRCH